MEATAGPLPHPLILREYGELVPGAAETIIEMADRRAKHIEQMEREESARKNRALEMAPRNQLIGGALFAVFMLVAAWIGEWPGGAVLISLAILVAAVLGMNVVQRSLAKP